MRELSDILKDFRETFRIVREEEVKRQEVMESEDYKNLEVEIHAAKEKQQDMLKGIPDGREEYDLDKQELMDAMKELGITSAEEFKAKTRKVRKVDVHAVLRAMEGDIDNLVLVSSIKMKDLEKFMKDNPEYKRDLRKCIVDEGFTISDIFLSEE